jgi:hypothetical protein
MLVRMSIAQSVAVESMVLLPTLNFVFGRLHYQAVGAVAGVSAGVWRMSIADW